MKVMTIDQAIRHFRGMDAEIAKANAIGVRDGSELMLRTAREIIGNYQLENLGEAPPWAELADRTKDERVRLGYTENDPGLRSGEMQQSYGVRMEVVGPVAASSTGSDDPKALWFEGGTVRSDSATSFYQPPREVLSVAAFRDEHQVVDAVAAMIVRAMEGRPLPNRRATELDDHVE